ncbi:MAG: S9 family peptidase [Bryobacteraceae bacterium]|nr:S9 family peptidase [Bryobacteraceae bacterium]
MRIHRYACWLGTLMLPAMLLAADPAPPPVKKDTMKPPVAPIRPFKVVGHNQTRTDNYYWLRERNNPEVIAHLKSENAYLDSTLAGVKPLRETLVNEFRKRIRQNDESAPWRKDGYLYYTRMVEGKNYPVLCRREGSMDAPEQVMVDGNKEGEGKSFFSIGSMDVSPDHKLLAWAADVVGRRRFTLRFRDLATGRDLAETLTDISSEVAWANDNKTVFYIRKDPQTLRAYQVWRHTLGTAPGSDKLIYEEKDTQFDLDIRRSKSGRFIFIESHQTLTGETLFLDANTPEGRFQVFEPRKRDRLYNVEHLGQYFFVRTNDQAKDFRLLRTPVTATTYQYWEEVVPHRPGTLLAGVQLFNEFLVMLERNAGVIRIHVQPWAGLPAYVEFSESAYSVNLTHNYDVATTLLRFEYSSLTTPKATYDYDLGTKERTLLKQDEVRGGFDSKNYVTERIYAPSADGVPVPVSVVYRKTTKLDGTAPLYQYGYGSYGISSDPAFSPYVISLLDRGFVYAIAHIRGGQENGRQWYEDGKLLKKKNTFRDFISVTEHLVKQKYADPKNVFAMGGSAGGLLMGAVMNMRPDLYRGIIAGVPFVDVVTTMLDDTIPLTTFEYDEWGNPGDQTYYEYMMSYSPYDQVEKKAYPNLLVTTGLHDSQVQYFEPAKWVAKLRAMKTDDNLLMMYTNMDAGHGGASARYKKYEEVALQYSFVLQLASRTATVSK